MKIFFIIALVWSITAICFTRCRIEKILQVKEIGVTLIDIKDGGREERGHMYWLTWRDERGTDYLMLCPCPGYKIGDTRTFLITR
jgi:hypothetical protein